MGKPRRRSRTRRRKHAAPHPAVDREAGASFAGADRFGRSDRRRRCHARGPRPADALDRRLDGFIFARREPRRACGVRGPARDGVNRDRMIGLPDRGRRTHLGDEGKRAEGERAEIREFSNFRIRRLRVHRASLREPANGPQVPNSRTKTARWPRESSETPPASSHVEIAPLPAPLFRARQHIDRGIQILASLRSSAWLLLWSDAEKAREQTAGRWEASCHRRVERPSRTETVAAAARR